MIDIRLTDNGETVDMEFSDHDDATAQFGFRCNKKFFLTWIEVAAEWIAREGDRRHGNATEFALDGGIIPVSFVPFDDDGAEYPTGCEDNGNTDDLISRALREAGEI